MSVSVFWFLGRNLKESRNNGRCNYQTEREIKKIEDRYHSFSI